MRDIETRETLHRKVLLICGRYARDTRQKAGLSLKGMSLYTGYSESALSKFERGMLDSLWLMCLYLPTMNIMDQRNMINELEGVIAYDNK